MPSETLDTVQTRIPPEMAGQRLDKALAVLFPEYSRSSLQLWLKQGLVTLNGETPKQRDRVAGGELISITQPEAEQITWAAQTLDKSLQWSLVFEDEHILVVNKSAGLVVHPGAGNPDNTLINALLNYDPSLNTMPRAGIVHRIDKDTSGLLVVARNEVTRLRLIDALQTHSIERNYVAIVNGVMISGGSIDEPIGRHSRDRKRMAVTPSGKSAITHYRVAQKFRAHTLVSSKLETGRTHQIRVHMAHLGFPLVGDPVYGGRLKIPANTTEALREQLRQFRRQALHAKKLSLHHPQTDEWLSWSQPLPDDMQHLVQVLREDKEQHQI